MIQIDVFLGNSSLHCKMYMSFDLISLSANKSISGLMMVLDYNNVTMYKGAQSNQIYYDI